jgi:hypothetical protein
MVRTLTRIPACPWVLPVLTGSPSPSFPPGIPNALVADISAVSALARK